MAVDQKPIWLRQAFLLPIDDNKDSYGSNTKRRYANSAAFKFTNASLGGNFVMNPLPQYTRFADIRQKGRGRTEANKFEGQGRYYSEAHDDTMQEIHMSFGVPRFSSWSGFFTNFYDRHAAGLATKGFVDTAWYNLGNVTGFFITLPLQPFILGVTGASRVISFLTRTQPSKWFYFKPTMHAYWSAVNTIANEFAVTLGITPRIWHDTHDGLPDPKDKVTAEDVKEWHRIFPSFFREDGGVDVMALAGRAQRMADSAQRSMESMTAKAKSIKALRETIESEMNKAVKDPNAGINANTYFKEYLEEETKSGASIEGTESLSSWSKLEGVSDFLTGQQRDGTQFVSFRAEYNGEVSESFSNSTAEVGYVQSLNTKVTEGRVANFNYMGGSLAPGVGGVMDAVKGWVGGALDSVNLSGLETLAGAAFIDVPEYWESSMASLPSATYTVTLNPTYGNTISRFLDMFVPLAMLLPMVMPLAAGRSAYTSPLLCQIFHRGRVQRQLGIVSDMSIRRGVGNVGWTAEHEMLNCEVTFTVKDLSKLMYMPVKAGFAGPSWLGTGAKAATMVASEAVAEALGGEGKDGLAAAAALTDGAVWDEQSLFNDYIASLVSQPWSDYYYIGKRLNINLTRAVTKFNSWRSPSNLGVWATDTFIPRTISAFAQTSDRF